jgi:large subunit ribosomal protein L18e
MAKDLSIVVFPGKVLGTGNISHKITLFSFSISNSAAAKIIEKGGKLITHSDLIEQNPTGKGVVGESTDLLEEIQTLPNKRL